jgi:hypothetical protein
MTWRPVNVNGLIKRVARNPALAACCVADYGECPKLLHTAPHCVVIRTLDEPASGQ